MTRSITRLFLGIALITAFQANAQYCGNSQIIDTTNLSTYGFGDLNTYPCIIRGQQNDTLIIPLKVYNSFTVGTQTVNIVKMQINTLDSLPCGMCWSTTKSKNPNNLPNEFDANESALLKISGTTNDPAGAYQLVMTINVSTSTANDTAFNPVSPIDSRAGGISLLIKVADSTGSCPDTIITTNEPRPSCVTNGIYQISSSLKNLSIQPNPMSNESVVSFTSEIGGAQQIRISDIEGREVYSTIFTAKSGQNETTINRNNLPAGIYILSVGNEQGTATRKFIIAD
jgi:hypothetical protein